MVIYTWIIGLIGIGFLIAAWRKPAGEPKKKTFRTIGLILLAIPVLFFVFVQLSSM